MSPIINSAILSREPYILPRQEKSFRYKLDICINPEPISPEVTKVLTAENVHLYPAHDEVYDKLKLAVQNYSGVNPEDENIIFTNGSDNALNAVIEAYYLPDTSVLIPTPTYPHLVEFARNAKSSKHGDICFLSQTSSEISGLQEALRRQKHNLCYLCSPNLPLGYSFTVHQIYELLNEFEDTMFIVDEAYIQYTEHYQAVRQASSAASLITRFQNLVVTSTFSKAFGLAGLRIGYLLTHPSNILPLKVLINQKSVTSVAMRAALKTIEQLPYYNAQIKRVQKLKEKIKGKLRCLCDTNTEIYGYNVAGGNFFLLFAKNTKLVCGIFEQHGIYLRDKSSEIPDAIRSCIGTERQMDEVLLLIAFVNQGKLFRDSSAFLHNIRVVCDLDNTLRAGSKKSSKWHSLDPQIITNEWIVCTNNSTETPQEFQRQIEEGMNLKIEKVVSPVTFFRENFWSSSYIVGSQSVKDILQHSDEVMNIFAVLVTRIPSSHEEIVTICKLHHELHVPVLHTDSTDYSSLKSCAEIEDASEKTVIPDLGSYMKLMNVRSTCIDKSSGADNENKGYNNSFNFAHPSKQVFVIGDSMHSDKALADSIQGSIFIHVDPTTHKPKCNLDQMYISVPNIRDL